MKIVILDAKTLGDDLTLDMFDEFGEVVIYPTTAPDEVEERISDADIIILNKVKVNASNLPAAKKARLICITATGFDNVDIDYCEKHNIAVCNVKAYSTHSVAQLTMSMALSLYTHLTDYTDYVADGSYTSSGVHNHMEPVFHEIYGKTWGVVGLGAIGRQVARIARTMGCNVLAFKRSDDSEFDVADLDTLCRESDIISIHLPLNEQTNGIISRERIAMMKKDAVVINVARGAVADEAALADAIKNDNLGGIGIDVYSKEPMSAEHPYNEILDRKNVLLTPHMAWGAYESRLRCMNEIAENIRAFLKGESRNRVK